MESSSLTAPYSKLLANYMGIIWCSLGGHINQRTYCCKKEKNKAYLCTHCGFKSKYLNYLYKCDACETYVCFTHFKDHQLLNSLDDKFAVAIDCASTRVKGNDLDKISKKDCKILGRSFHSPSLRILKDVTVTSIAKIYATLNTKFIKELGNKLIRPKLEHLYLRTFITHQ